MLLLLDKLTSVPCCNSVANVLVVDAKTRRPKGVRGKFNIAGKHLPVADAQ